MVSSFMRTTRTQWSCTRGITAKTSKYWLTWTSSSKGAAAKTCRNWLTATSSSPSTSWPRNKPFLLNLHSMPMKLIRSEIDHLQKGKEKQVYIYNLNHWYQKCSLLTIGDSRIRSGKLFVRSFRNGTKSCNLKKNYSSLT